MYKNSINICCSFTFLQNWSFQLRNRTRSYHYSRTRRNLFCSIPRYRAAARMMLSNSIISNQPGKYFFARRSGSLTKGARFGFCTESWTHRPATHRFTMSDRSHRWKLAPVKTSIGLTRTGRPWVFSVNQSTREEEIELYEDVPGL